MKILHLNTSDINGGAARAAYRLHQGLRNIGIDSQMLVQDKNSDDHTVIGPQTKMQKGWGKIRPTLDTIPLQLYQQRDRAPYSLQWLPNNVNSKIKSIAPDIINLHWIGGGYFPVETIAKFEKPIVWTLHDMWAFTGGCHYSGKCDRYSQSCGRCPQLNSNNNWDLSRWLWQRKVKAWKDQNITIVAPSQWMADCAKKSSLFKHYRIEVIPNGLDTIIYKPIDKKVARNILGLPENKQIILFGAMNATSGRRKGFHLLLPALKQLTQFVNQDKIELAIFGSSKPENAPDFGFTTKYLGRLYDDISLSLVYSAADIFLCTSLEDNLPNTILESLACGTPCVAFNIGGVSDMIDHEKNGYLVEPFFDKEFAAGIAWILANEDISIQFIKTTVDRVRSLFSQQKQACLYNDLFQEILS